MRMQMRPYEHWLWGGSLLLAVLTRQVALGLVPLALAHGQWQRRQVEQRLTQQWDQQWQVQQQYMAEQVQQQLRSVHTAISSLRTHPPETVADPRVTELLAEVGSLAEQVQQLQVSLQAWQEQPRSHLSVRQQTAPLTQGLHLLQDRLRRLELQALPQLTETQQALQEQLSQLQRQMEQRHPASVSSAHSRSWSEQESLGSSAEPRKGVGVFIDGANLHAGARDLNLHLDYEQLMPVLLPDREQAEIHFYSGFDPQNPKQKAFHQALERQLGFRLHLKARVRYANGSSKANLDGEMIVDMLRGRYERVILLSGDGDFLPALQHLRKQGVQVEVAAFGPDTHHQMRQFVFTDLRNLLAPGPKVLALPAKQVSPNSSSNLSKLFQEA